MFWCGEIARLYVLVVFSERIRHDLIQIGILFDEPGKAEYISTTRSRKEKGEKM